MFHDSKSPVLGFEIGERNALITDLGGGDVQEADPEVPAGGAGHVGSY
jgi:hypothetical protein